MAVVRKIGVMSLAKLQAVLMAVVGLIMGIFYALLSLIIGTQLGDVGVGAGLGFLGIIVLPVLYAIFGFIGGAIGALLYNLVAKWVGGVDLEFEG